MCLSVRDGAREWCRFVELESMALESLLEFQVSGSPDFAGIQKTRKTEKGKCQFQRNHFNDWRHKTHLSR